MEGPTQAIDHGRVRLRIGDGGPDLAPAMTSGQTPQRHETGHSFSTHAISFAGQDGSDPRCAVCGATLGVDLDDLGPELRVLERTWARLVVMPAIEGGARDLHQSARRCHVAL